MAAKARPIPEGFHSVTPHLTVRDAVKMIEFYKKAFGAKEIEVKKMPDGKVIHAKIKIGDTFVMLNDEFPEMGGNCASLSPAALKGVSCTLNLYVEDADFVWKQALAAGATEAIDPNVKAAVQEMERALGTKVRIVEKSGHRGRIEIDYYSSEDLDRIYSVIVSPAE